jgi:hypothetical protein
VSYDCFCDYDPPSMIRESEPVARKDHRCTECGRRIAAGERYSYTWGIWDGMADTFKTCPRCLALRDYVKAHVPCLCWAYGSVTDDCIEAAQEYAHEAPGLLFGAYRRLVLIKRAPTMSRATQ